MLVAGDLALLGSTLIAPAALLAWILTGRGPGQRLLLYGVGGPRLGKLFMARASQSGLF
jgi:hypothetical protein